MWTIWAIYLLAQLLDFSLEYIRIKQARKLQDAQAEKLTSLQAYKLTSWKIDKLLDWQRKRRFDYKMKIWHGEMVAIKATSCQQFPDVTKRSWQYPKVAKMAKVD